MCEIIPFPSRKANMCDDDIVLFPNSAPVAPDPFPGLTIYSVDYGRALMDAHVPAALADALVEMVAASPECRHRCSFHIYERDENTARIDACVPMTIVRALGEMLEACAA
jgi:hypothetical protein